MRCLHCHTDGIAATATACPACGVYLPSLLRDVLPAGATLRASAYQLDYPLGRGGFGITYRAMYTALEQVVAIKEFYPQDHADREGATGHLSIPATQQESYQRGLARFIREGRLLARLAHPGIVRVSDLFEERGTAYLVMELVAGRSLRAELDAQPEHRISPERVADLMGQLVEALAVMHAADIYHLDLSPENILLASSGRAVLADFGAARQGFSRKTTQAFRPEYAAPEVLAGRDAGPQSDLFELAMVAHELLTGARAPAAVDRLLDDRLDLTGFVEPWRSLLDQALRLHAEHRPESVAAWWGAPPASGTAVSGVTAPPPPLLSGTRAAVRVAVDGSGDYPNLAEAVRQAAPGLTIALSSGAHRLDHPFTIDKPLTLGGIAYFGNTTGAARRNTCRGNEQHGIYVGEQATPTLEENVCEQNKWDGSAYVGNAGGIARRNICRGNEQQGIYVQSGAMPRLEGNIT